MKIELIEEKKLNGDVLFSVEVNGKFVSGSLSNDKAKTIAIYEKAIRSKATESRTVLLSQTIDD